MIIRYKFVVLCLIAILGLLSYMYAVKTFYLPIIQKDQTKEANNFCQQSIRNSKSEWFKTKFKEMNPFWTRSNIEQDEESLKWWMSIQRSKPENLTEVLLNAFKTGIPSDATGHTKTSKCKTCAVIGNSYILKDSKHGNEIDRNDIIIRMNKAKVMGFQEDVGQKTTFRISYPESALPSYDDAGLLLLAFKPLDIRWLTSALTTGEIKRTYINVLSKINCNATKIRISSPSFFRYCYTDWVEKHGRYPSTGIFGVLLALQMCDQVNVFGFGSSEDGAWTHYWEKPKSIDKAFRKTNVHSGDFERDLLLKLEDEGIIKRYK